MIPVDDVAAMVVTRGDVDLDAALRDLPFTRVVVWDNSRLDLAVYGRYYGIADVSERCRAIYVQDDDCVVAPESVAALLAAYEPGKVVCNMPDRFRPHYPDSALVGFGAIFDRELPDRGFRRYFSATGTSMWDRAFQRTCDVVFTTLTERKLVDLPYRDLPWCDAPNRMWKQPEHVGERQAMLARARAVRDR